MATSDNQRENPERQYLPTADVLNARGTGPVLLVCEHASRKIPAEFQGLGLPAAEQIGHIAWDPGALEMGVFMAEALEAKLVISTVSRLLYDCNRPPEAPGAMPEKSEIFEIPGNQNLSKAQRDARTERYYRPFQTLLAKTIASATTPAVLVTIHSFTPVFQGARRDVEVGILHDSDSRLADAMLRLAPQHTSLAVHRNEPYGPQDGVTHTLKEHGIKNGLLNVMIEVRNDLIATAASQRSMAETLSNLITDALAQLADAQK